MAYQETIENNFRKSPSYLEFIKIGDEFMKDNVIVANFTQKPPLKRIDTEVSLRKISEMKTCVWSYELISIKAASEHLSPLIIGGMGKRTVKKENVKKFIAILDKIMNRK